MAYTVHFIETNFPDYSTHEASVKTYLDGQSPTTIHALDTFVVRGKIVTVIVFE